MLLFVRLAVHEWNSAVNYMFFQDIMIISGSRWSWMAFSRSLNISHHLKRSSQLWNYNLEHLNGICYLLLWRTSFCTSARSPFHNFWYITLMRHCITCTHPNINMLNTDKFWNSRYLEMASSNLFFHHIICHLTRWVDGLCSLHCYLSQPWLISDKFYQ